MLDSVSKTSWPRIAVFFAAGVAVASLVGKAPAVLPLLQQELDLSLPVAGLVISIMALLAATVGIAFGALADRAGPARFGIAGLLLAATASALGAMADGQGLLLATRVAEGVGLFMTSVSMPPLMLKVSAPGDRAKAMGLWGAFMPAGSGMMLLIGGAMATVAGWQGVWLFTSALLVAAALAVWLAAPRVPPYGKAAAPHPIANAKRVLEEPGARLLTLTFMAYSAQFMSVTGFVPLILVDRAGWGLTEAGIAAAAVTTSNVIGNLLSGVLLDRGTGRGAVIGIASAAMALGATLLMTDFLPVWLRLAGGIVFSGIGGLIPGALFAGTAIHAPQANMVSTVNGMMFQGSSIGQLLGPVIVTWIVAVTGTWTAALAFTLPAAVVCAWAGAKLGRLERQ